MTTLVTPTDRQLTRVQLTDPELRNQVSHRVRELDRRHVAVFGDGQQPPLPRLLACNERAEVLHSGLVAGGPLGVLVAQAVLSGLVGPVEAGQAEFWETALGRVIALRGGYPQEAMPRLHAAALLDVTRQRISQMEAVGLLEANAGGLITTASLTRLLVPA
jgi:hypothetical protein